MRRPSCLSPTWTSASIKREAVTKGDLREETAKVREGLRDEIAEVREELRTGLAKVREEMARMEGRLIRWMFLFWVGQMAAMLGILALLLRS